MILKTIPAQMKLELGLSLAITYAKMEFCSETFADNRWIFIKVNTEYLRKYVEFLKHFAKISYLQCNLGKTSVTPIKGNYDINHKSCPETALS